jgi:hypothetical protein
VSAPSEFHFLLDSSGALIVFQETGAPWASVLAFSSEEGAREFIRTSHLDIAEIASIAADDRDAIADLIRSVKRRAVRNLLLDLDYTSGECVAMEFEGDALGITHEHRMTPGAHARKH